jgi:hypothetical protein
MSELIFLHTKYFLYFLISIFFLYSVGFFLRYVIRDFLCGVSFIKDFFYASALGLIAVVTIYAIVISGFKTVFIGVITIGVFYIWYLKSHKSQTLHSPWSLASLKPNIKEIFIIVTLSFLCFEWEAYFFIRNDVFHYNIPMVDIAFYSRIATFLNHAGVESTYNYDIFFDDIKSRFDLYHFFELWITAFLSKIFDTPAQVIHLLLTIPYFIFLFTVGIASSLIEKFNLAGFIVVALAVASLFLTELNFEFYKDIYYMRYAEYITGSLIYSISKKLGPFYLVVLLFFILYIEKRKVEALLILLLLPLMTIVTLPTIYIGFGIGVTALLIYGYINKKIFVLLIGVAAVNLLIVAVLYFTINRGYSSSGIGGNSISELFNQLSIIILITRLKLMIGTTAQVVILFGLHLFLFLLLCEVKKIKFSQVVIILLIISGITFSGLLLWAILLGMPNSNQLYIYITICFFQIGFIFIFIEMFNKKILNQQNMLKNYVFFIFLSLLIAYNIQYYYQKQNFSFYRFDNVYTSNYLLQVNNIIHHHKKIDRVASYIDSISYNNHFIKDAVHMMRLGDYLGLMTNNLSPISINDTELPAGLNMKIAKSVFSLPFYQYAQNYPHLPITQVQENFMRKYKMPYLIVSKHKNIDDWNLIIKQTVVDEKTGERFIVLDWE